MSAQVRVRHPFSFLALIGRGTFRRLFRTVRLLRLNGILRHHTPFKVSLFLFRLLPFLPYYIIAISSALKIFLFFPLVFSVTSCLQNEGASTFLCLLFVELYRHFCRGTVLTAIFQFFPPICGQFALFS